MFPDIRVTHDLDRLLDHVRNTMPKQVEFTAALTLTMTGQDAKAAVEREMEAVFDRPTPFTRRGFRLFPATRQRLEARLVFRHDFGRDYLHPQVLGGERKLKAFERSLQRVGLLPSHLQALPGRAAQLDQYGNMRPSQIVQLISYFQAFSEEGYKANMTDDRKAQIAKRGRHGKHGFVRKGQWTGYSQIGGVEYFVVSRTKTVRGREQSLPEGIWSRSGVHGSVVKPIVMFVRRSRYTKRLRFFELVADVIERRLPINFQNAWGRAQASRRPGR